MLLTLLQAAGLSIGSATQAPLRHAGVFTIPAHVAPLVHVLVENFGSVQSVGSLQHCPPVSEQHILFAPQKLLAQALLTLQVSPSGSFFSHAPPWQ
jgi:hypothetical protein